MLKELRKIEDSCEEPFSRGTKYTLRDEAIFAHLSKTLAVLKYFSLEITVETNRA